MAAALRALLLVAGHRDQLARVLLRAADVDQVGVGLERVEDLVAAGADRVVAGLGLEVRLGWDGTSVAVSRPSSIHFSRGPLMSFTLSWP